MNYNSVQNDIENVLPVLNRWSASGEKCALVTIVNIEGGSPRPLGAQMVVSETGKAFGHISGGCLKSEIIHKAIELIKSRENKTIRYGAGSQYVDIVLPCGSGLDLYFDVNNLDEIANTTAELTENRIPFTLDISLKDGSKTIRTGRTQVKTECKDNLFIRQYTPKQQLLIFGTDPAVSTLAILAKHASYQVYVYSPDTDVLEDTMQAGIEAFELTHGKDIKLNTDKWTSAALFFHDHSWELPILSKLLKTDCIYIGAQGAKVTHEARLQTLIQSGVDQSLAQTIKGPIGLISSSKSPAELAVSVLAEIMSQTKSKK